MGRNKQPRTPMGKLLGTDDQRLQVDRVQQLLQTTVAPDVVVIVHFDPRRRALNVMTTNPEIPAAAVRQVLIQALEAVAQQQGAANAAAQPAAPAGPIQPAPSEGQGDKTSEPPLPPEVETG